MSIKSLLEVSEIRISGGSGVELHVPDIAHAGEVHDHALKAQAVAGVTAAAVAAQVQIPPVVLFLQSQLRHALGEHVQPLLALAAADDLAHAGHQAVGCGHGLPVVVHAHIEGLYVLGIVSDKDGLLEHFLGKVALMLGLQIYAPLHREVELLS